MPKVGRIGKKAYIGEDERLCWVEANGNDVLGVAAAVALNLLDGSLLGEEVLFIVRQHDDKLWHWLADPFSRTRNVNMPERQTYPGALLDPVSRGFSKTEDRAQYTL